MPKKRLQVWLSEAALEELAQRAGAPDKRQQYLESLFTGGLRAFEELASRITDGTELLKTKATTPDHVIDMAVKQVERIASNNKTLPLARDKIVSIPKPGKTK